MNELLTGPEYRTIVQALAVVRLQGWLLLREIETRTLDEASILERLSDIDRQTATISQVMDGMRRLTPAASSSS